MYILSNNQGIEARFISFGARLTHLIVPDKYGNPNDIVLGFDMPESYRKAHETYFGAIIGRYANRISNGIFKIKNKEYHLEKEGKHLLHGGRNGFHQKEWTVLNHDENHVHFRIISENEEGGFPGEVTTDVIYRLQSQSLLIEYKCVTTEDTHINITPHSFFHLGMKKDENVLNHSLEIQADSFIPINQEQIPTGEIKDVSHTVFDFAKSKPIGMDIEKKEEQLVFGNGYDHNYVLRKEVMNGKTYAAKVHAPDSGITMELHTNQPGLQFYSCGWLDKKDLGKDNVRYGKFGALCLEPQHFPDSPNQANFPSTLITPKKPYEYFCEYRFV